MASVKKKNWLGGYIRWGKKGPTFIIERWIDGKRFHVSTKCRMEKAALEQLALFESDPANYKPTRARGVAAAKAPAVVTDQSIADYRAWMLTPGVAGRETPATERHADKHELALIEWMGFLRGRDIRSVPLQEFAAHVAKLKNRPMRIQALKAYCGWLRQVEFVLTRNDDPTLDLKAPAGRATKDTAQVAIEPERIIAVLPHLPDASRDAMILRLGTGWHTSEVQRFATEGHIRYTPGKSIFLLTETVPVRTPLLATLEVRQLKARKKTNTPIIYEEHLAAAERIQRRRYVPHEQTLRRHLKAACDKAGVERFWNWHIRHSVVSYASESGAELEHSSTFIDHVGIDTGRAHYRQIALPKKAVPVLRVMDGGKQSAS